MELTGVTFRGPEISDEAVLESLPDNLCSLLRAINGFIQFGGGLHVRGAVLEPEWHSLRAVLEGEWALHARYDSVNKQDVPFAQDCVGDQFLLRDGVVLRLFAETGEVCPQAEDLASFFRAANQDPIDYLSLQPLQILQAEGGALEPGQLISVYPPFYTKESADGVSVRAVPAQELIQVHAEFASQLPEEGGEIRIDVVDD